MGEVFGMPRKGEARAILQHLLGNRRGAERRCLTRLHQRHGAGDDVDHALRIAQIGLAGGGGVGEVMYQDGQHIRRHRQRPKRRVNRLPSGACGQMPGIADPCKGQIRPQRQPRLDCDFRTDACGIAAGQHQRCRAHLISIRASDRSSSI